MGDYETLRELSEAEQVAYFLEQLKAINFVLPDSLPLLIQGLLQVYKANDQDPTALSAATICGATHVIASQAGGYKSLWGGVCGGFSGGGDGLGADAGRAAAAVGADATILPCRLRPRWLS